MKSNPPKPPACFEMAARQWDCLRNLAKFLEPISGKADCQVGLGSVFEASRPLGITDLQKKKILTERGGAPDTLLPQEKGVDP